MLFEPLFANAKTQPDDLAVIDDHGKYSYQQLAQMAAGLGMYLSFQSQKQHVGLLLPPGVGFVASFYGTLLAGKTVVPINYLLGDKEIAHIIQDSDMDTVLTVPFFMPRLKDLNLNVIDLMQLPRTGLNFEPQFPNVKPDDVAVLLYTSGTSGLPKGVLLTYENLQSDVDASIEHAALRHKHIFLGIIPLFHSFGITAMMIAPIQLGATVVYIARFSPVATIKALREHKASILFGTPSMFAAIARLKDATPEDFSSIYAIITGGEPLPEALRETFKKRFNITLYEGYGLTETSPVVAINTPQHNRPGSVGAMVPGAEARITDEDGNATPRGQIGEIWLKGPMIMKGYHNLPQETAEALTPDRYFRTGDLGRLDDEGFLYITGRKKEMIIVAGEKAYPREIEDVILRHPAVHEVAVLGKKDPGRGEAVVAFAIPKEGQTVQPDELRSFARDQGLAQWKVPREIYIVDDLPRSATGKVLKRELAQKLNAG
ncbi:MAG TPA: AMP-binding protein [Tepidisphaeraceae bacterium]|nr:AMP-binding protein [Tepidisphaeraceae bacterium]